MTDTLEIERPWRSPVPEDVLVERRGVRMSDRSRYRRWGVRGPMATDWLVRNSIAIPAEPNMSVVSDGLCAARLSAQEFLFLAVSRDGASRLASLERQAASAPMAGVYDLPRQDMSAWLSLVGEGVAALMRELCAVDLRQHRFPDGTVAQTSIASQNAIAIRRDEAGVYGLDILVDFAGAVGLWGSLSGGLAGHSPN